MSDVPASYEDFYRQYKTLVRIVVAGWMSNRRDEIDDVVSEIMLKIWQRDIINNYDPTKSTSFESYIRKTVWLYARGMAETLFLKNKHYSVIYDQPDVIGSSTIGQYLTPPRYLNPTANIEYMDKINELRAIAAQYHDYKNVKLSTPEFFDMLIAILEMYGELSRDAIAHFQEFYPEMSAGNIIRRRARVGQFIAERMNGASV